MTLRTDILLLIFVCALVTIVPRVLPLVFARRLTLPPKLEIWLQQVPVAVIAALFFREVMAGGVIHLAAGVVALSVAFVGRNLVVAVIVGMAAYALLNFFFL